MPTPEKRNEVRSGTDGRSVHDVGGLDFGPIDRAEHDLALWEKRVDAMIVLLNTKKHVFTTDAMRRVIESYNEQQYDSTAYFEKWVRALRNLVLEQELITQDELEAKLREAAQFFRDHGREVQGGEVPHDDIGAGGASGGRP
ncbi:MAG: nitrile hydratase subunit beta [Hyphomicrobiaceae bacterium]|nr:nitrile hydratase subunit beta [Hyphomicrobiaceae bacterium]